MEQFEKGEAILDKGLAQLEHAFDLALHQIKDPELRHKIKQYKQSILNEHRDDFVRYGKQTVAPNLRYLLQKT